MFVFVSLNVAHVPVAVPVQFQETTVPVQFKETRVTVQEGENVTVTLIALANHSYGFVVNVKVMDGTAKRMHIAQCRFLCSVN